MAENNEIKYSDAIQELESIVRKMQSECSIDELSAYTKRALQLQCALGVGAEFIDAAFALHLSYYAFEFLDCVGIFNFVVFSHIVVCVLVYGGIN